MTFKTWESQCNSLMLKKYGIGIDDIPDMTWHNWYVSEWTPEEAVKEAIKITNDGEWI